MFDLQEDPVEVHAFVHPIMAFDLKFVADANDWNPERTVREALRIGLKKLEYDVADQFFCQDQILEYVREAIANGRTELFFDPYENEDLVDADF
ncbi:hypothetical protein ACT3R5_13200 [Glutamicibacter sp. AOP5-A2-7]